MNSNSNLGLHKAIVKLKDEALSSGVIGDNKPRQVLDIAFTGSSRNLLKVLSDSFLQNEEEFAGHLLHLSLVETLRIMPDILSKEEFQRIEDKIIKEDGLGFYLGFQPIFPFEIGLNHPNYAEVSTSIESKIETVIGCWVNKDDCVEICDPQTSTVLYSYPKCTMPTMSVDGVTWQWNQTNVKPIYMDVIREPSSIVQALEMADVLFIEGVGHFHRFDEYQDEVEFSSFYNLCEKGNDQVLRSDFTDVFNMTNNDTTALTIEPIYSSPGVIKAKQCEDGSWLIGENRVFMYALQNVIISTEK